MGGRVQGDIAIVTGGAMGIGRAIALQLVEEGATVVVGDINQEALDKTITDLRAIGGPDCAHGVIGNVTEEAEAAALVEKALSLAGKVDILINNVGGGGVGKAWEMSVDEWDFAMRNNLRGMFLCTRAVLPGMMERKSGKVVCISSGAREGVQWLSNRFGATGYATAKAGILGFIRDLALQLGEYNVRVNALAVGAVATETMAPVFEELNETYEFSPKKIVPLRRVARPEEIASAALFLSTEESSYITGTMLNVNGGRT